MPSPPYGLGRQTQIYVGGLAGQKPSVPVPLAHLEAQAKQALRAEAYDYVAGGAGGEDTLRANLEAFRRWRLVPRMLRDVAERNLAVDLLGLRLPAPVLLAPVGVQSILHPDAELAAARAAASLGIPFILSTAASRTLEQVAEVMGPAPRWFQLYWPRDPKLAASLVRRAERAGYTAIVVTLDTAFLGWRERDLHHPYLPFLQGEGLANYFSDPVFQSSLAEPPEKDLAAAVRQWMALYAHPSLTWQGLGFLREHTRLPLLLKGILHPDDAARAVECRLDGLVVSNHGGRQVDGALAALDALPPIVERVEGRIPVLFDSGIRRGADALKALALGAKAVLLGRPYLWGLAVAGEPGVREVLLNFLADFDLTMALSGHAACHELSPLSLRHAAESP